MTDEPTNRELLAKAVELRLREEAEMQPEEELGDFIVIATGVAIDGSMHATARYYLLFREESMLPHIAIGLIDKGDSLVRENERGEDAG